MVWPYPKECTIIVSIIISCNLLCMVSEVYGTCPSCSIMKLRQVQEVM